MDKKKESTLLTKNARYDAEDWYLSPLYTKQ